MKSKATVETCDNPTCRYSEVIDNERGADGASGYHFGKGWWVMGGGGPIPAFYAHEVSCIVPAMQHVIEKAN